MFPDWVDETNEGYKTVTFRGFEALTVEALRELRAERNAEISKLRTEKDAEIETLRGKNAELEARLARIEAMLAAANGGAR